MPLPESGHQDLLLPDDDDNPTVELSLENFWKKVWNDTKPIPASEQELQWLDAVQEVEKILNSLENLSPIQLMNHVLEINFTTANELLHSMAGDALKVKFIEMTFWHLAGKTRAAVIQLELLLRTNHGTSNKLFLSNWWKHILKNYVEDVWVLI
jgi:hypothetical protein